MGNVVTMPVGGDLGYFPRRHIRACAAFKRHLAIVELIEVMTLPRLIMAEVSIRIVIRSGERVHIERHKIWEFLA